MWRMREVLQVRDSILGVAQRRFTHYGYPKTTMAEIADECDMSTGNLYRYFDGKLELATHIASNHITDIQERLQPILTCNFRTAAQRLEEYMLHGMRYSYDLLKNQPKLLEMVQIVAVARPRFQIRSELREKKHIASILRDGKEKGEFAIKSAEEMAGNIQTATLKFRYSPVFAPQKLEELEKELKNILHLILNGILPR